MIVALEILAVHWESWSAAGTLDSWMRAVVKMPVRCSCRTMVKPLDVVGVLVVTR